MTKVQNNCKRWQLKYGCYFGCYTLSWNSDVRWIIAWLHSPDISYHYKILNSHSVLSYWTELAHVFPQSSYYNMLCEYSSSVTWSEGERTCDLRWNLGSMCYTLKTPLSLDGIEKLKLLCRLGCELSTTHWIIVI